MLWEDGFIGSNTNTKKNVLFERNIEVLLAFQEALCLISKVNIQLNYYLCGESFLLKILWFWLHIKIEISLWISLHSNSLHKAPLSTNLFPAQHQIVNQSYCYLPITITSILLDTYILEYIIIHHDTSWLSCQYCLIYFVMGHYLEHLQNINMARLPCHFTLSPHFW